MKKITLFITLSYLLNAHSAWALSPEYKNLSPEQREVIYQAQKLDAGDIALQNLLPFAPGSMKVGDYAAVGLVSLFDVAAISYGTAATLSALNNEPDSGFGLFLGAIIVPGLYLAGRAIGLSTPWYSTAVYNQKLKNKLGLETPLQQTSSLNEPWVSYGFAF